MRKALKILLPLILVAVLLLGAYWFFFQYRKDLTAGLFANFGKNALEAEHYDSATRWYGYANQLDPGNVEIALNLADAYEHNGNYTKTEFVLRNAIAASPGCTDLYAALCRVYVTQDKLMDAQQMLDQILDETVLAELSQRRPAAPTVEPESGYYSDYISVTLTPGDSASCYLTVNGDFPSVRSEPYSEPVTLPAGVSTVRAVAVNSEGLVSPEVYREYTVAGVIEDAVFADAALERYVQELLNRGQRTLRTDELWDVTELDLPEDVTSLDDLTYFTGLTTLHLHDACGSDFSFLSSLDALRTLDLAGCELTTEQLTTICTLCPLLDTLNLSGCGLSNIEPLESLSALRVLDLSDNSINNVTPLSGLIHLEELYLSQNALTSLSALSKLTDLQVLDVSRNSLKSLAPLASCTEMRSLDFSNNSISDVSAVGKMTQLRSLYGVSNDVLDVSALSSCRQLQYFYMGDNYLETIDFLNDIATILEINIDYNNVVAVPSFRSDCALVNFSGAHNYLEDLSGLAGLQSLNYVNADYNNVRDIDVLESCPNLVQVNVFGTYIDEGGVLEEHGVIVNYIPDFSD